MMSNPKESSLMMPSIPALPERPKVSPASLRLPSYPVCTIKSTTTRSRKSKGLSMRSDKSSESTSLLTFWQAFSNASSGVGKSVVSSSWSDVLFGFSGGRKLRYYSNVFKTFMSTHLGWDWSASTPRWAITEIAPSGDVRRPACVLCLWPSESIVEKSRTDA